MSESAPAYFETGISGLDIVLQGGLLQGGVYIVQGEPGAGKTILGNQICFNHAGRGGRALFVTALAENHTRMLMHIGRLSFFDAAAMPGRIAYISAFDELQRDGLKGLVQSLTKEVVARNCGLLVLDGLEGLETSPDCNPLELKRFIHALQAAASMTGCTVFLLTTSGQLPAGVQHTLVDGVIEMRSGQSGWRSERDLQVLKRRGWGYLRGWHAFRITDDGILVFPRTEALLVTPGRGDVAGGPRLTTGIALLDEMLGGGLPQYSTTMLLGPPGCGKTTLGLQFLGECSENEAGLLFGFYESPAALRLKAGRLGLPVEDLLKAGAVEVAWQPAIEGLLDEACHRLIGDVRRRRVRRLVIEGLDAFEKLAAEPRRVGDVFTALGNELRNAGVTTLYTAELPDLVGPVNGRPMSGLPALNFSSIAENILIMRYVELGSDLHRMISVLKARDSRIDTRLRCYDILHGGIAIDASSARAAAILGDAVGEPMGPALSGRS